MKCPNCGNDNRSALKFCKKCGSDLTLPPAWFPGWRWHLRALAWIYVVLVVFFFGVSYLLHKLPPPYDQRHIPSEMTPWLNPHTAPPK
jgi:hypothetical protein